MKKEHDEYLCKNFPKLYRDRNKTPQQSCFSFGFEHGDGWFNIIKCLSMCIQGTIDGNTKERWRVRGEMRKFAKMTLEEQKKNKWLDGKMPEKIPQVVAQQVKEKMGTLRFYYYGGNDAIHNYVSFAELMSSLTCEKCSAPAETDWSKSWIITMCETCKNNKIQDYES